MSAYTSPALDDVVTWNTCRRVWAPAMPSTRTGKPSSARATLVASQLQVATAGTVAANSYGYAYYIGIDGNSNGRIERAEIEPGAIGWSASTRTIRP